MSSLLRPVLRNATTRLVTRRVHFHRTIITQRFTPDHEWIRYDDQKLDVGTVSITDWAQKALGDVVFVELPSVGAEIEQGALIGAVESVKAASDIYAPVSGKVLEVNTKLDSEPGLLNKDPEGEGWLCKIQITKADEIKDLLDEAAYKKLCEES